MAAMVARNLKVPHRLVCITDDDRGLDSSVIAVPLWDDHALVANPTYGHGPRCYRRLRAFSPEARQLIGPRFVSIDLDCVITGDVTALWDRPQDDFVIWGGQMSRRMGHWYNCSMWLLEAGARPEVWDLFDPLTSPREAYEAGRRGSDQGWVMHVLGWGEAVWGRGDGVYSFRRHILTLNPRRLPINARVVIFNGQHNPWTPEVRALPWVERHWC